MSQHAATRRYTAFISYAHQDNREDGRRWAEWLHQSLESYRVPRALVGRIGWDGGPVPRTLFPVFRDEEELAAADDLPRRIESALENSAALIVICSPRAARSRWVVREVEHYQHLGRHNRIFALIIDGEPMASDSERECLPPQLLTAQNGGSHAEVLAADARPDGRPVQGFTNASIWRQSLEEQPGRTERRAILRGYERRYADQLELARLKLIAGLLGVELDELRRRAAAARARRARVLGAIAVAIAILMTGLSIVAWQQSRQAEQQRLRAEQERDHANSERKNAEVARGEAEQLIRSLQNDVRGSLAAAGRSDVLTNVNRVIADYFARHPPVERDVSGLSARADQLSENAQLQMNGGNLTAANLSLQQEFDLRNRILDLSPKDESNAFRLAACLQNQGILAFKRKTPAEAIAPLRAALQVIKEHGSDNEASYRPILLLLLSQALAQSGRPEEAAEIKRQADEAQTKIFDSINQSIRSDQKVNDGGDPYLNFTSEMQRVLPVLQRATNHQASLDEIKKAYRDIVGIMERFDVALQKLNAAEPDNVASLNQSIAQLESLLAPAVQLSLRSEAVRLDRILLRCSRRLVHSNPGNVDVALQHADHVLEYLGLLCGKAESNSKPVVTTEISNEDRTAANLLVAEANQWLALLPPEAQEKPELRARVDQLNAWRDALVHR
jgi:tetratricopeptide (TPR) repeat protein